MSAEFIDYEVILEIRNAGDQAFIKSLLEAEGIAFLCQGEHVAPYLFHALPMRIMVRKDQVAEAKELLRDMKLSTAYSGLKRREPLKDE
jgi:hypothetical protein